MYSTDVDVDDFGSYAKRFLSEEFDKVTKNSQEGNVALLKALSSISAAIKENTREMRQLREIIEPKTIKKPQQKSL